MSKSKTTQEEIAAMIARARRKGITNTQRKVWQGLADWFCENPAAPSVKALAQYIGVSQGTVYWSYRVLEALGYIRFNRHESGVALKDGLRLVKYPPMFTVVIVRHKSSGYINQSATVIETLRATANTREDYHFTFDIAQLYQEIIDAAGDDAHMITRQTVYNTAYQVAQVVYQYKGV